VSVLTDTDTDTDTDNGDGPPPEGSGPSCGARTRPVSAHWVSLDRVGSLA